jgi:hypothetical protein
MLPTESSNELAFVLRAELDPTVGRIYAQAVRIEWCDGDRMRHHVPDFVVIRDGRVEVHEVKPDAEAATEEVAAVTAQAARWFGDRGATYCLALESTLKAQPTYRNAEEVAYRLHDYVAAPLARAVVAFVQDAGRATIGEVVRALGTEGCTYERVLTLVARGAVHLDYSRPLDAEAVLSADAVPPSGAILLPQNAPLTRGTHTHERSLPQRDTDRDRAEGLQRRRR